MRISGTGMPKANSSSNSRAFTLIELIVVIAILGITLGYIGPRIYSGISTSNMDKASREVLALIQYARSNAVTKHTVYYIRFDIERSTFGIYPRPESSGEIEIEKEKALPRGVTFKSVKSPYQSEKIDGKADIMVTTEGVIEQGVIYLQGGPGTIHTLVIKPFSGMLKVYDHYVEVVHEKE
ncbi:type II secretion system protein [bacterium]|nr:type II secretion system protein [bacterium]